MNKIDYVKAIDNKLGYKLLPAYEMFTTNEIRDIYRLVVKENKIPLFINNECLFIDDRMEN